MTERPIIFSGPMVRAILDGSKTQTRRVVTDHTSQGNFKASEMLLDDPRTFVDPGPSPAGNPGPYLHARLNCPLLESNYGWQPGGCCSEVVERLYPRVFPGDLLYVRETWGTVRMHELGQHIFGDGPIPDSERVVFRAGRLVRSSEDAPLDFKVEDWPTRWADDFAPDGGRWKPSIHMPKRHARLWLRVTDVRVERVQEISEGDAFAEGVEGQSGPQGSNAMDFMHLWDSINAKRAPWESNPWVWVVTFEVKL